MKNIILTVTLLCIIYSLNAQIKIKSTGVLEAYEDVKISKDLYVGDESDDNEAELFIGKNRTQAGESNFNLYHLPDATHSSFEFKVYDTGKVRMSANTDRFLEIRTVKKEDIWFKTHNITRMKILKSGNVDIIGNATVNGGVDVTSDSRLKKDIKDFDKGLKEVLEIRPVTYTYNGEGNTIDDGRSYIGVVAQELRRAVPELVSLHTHEQEDENGDISSSKDYYKVHDSQVQYLLINAIQDQQAIIDKQSELIGALEARLDRLEKNISNGTETIEIDGADNAKLYQNEPNPFDDYTLIKFDLPSKYTEGLIVFSDQSGKVIKKHTLSTNQNELRVATNDLPPGTYNYSLIIDGQISDTKRMILSN